MECYVFDSLNEAENALAYIDEAGGCPITGRNNLGILEPTKAKVETWAIIRQRATDGKYFYPRVDEATRNTYPATVLNEFNNNYTFSIEIFESAWVIESGVV